MNEPMSYKYNNINKYYPNNKHINKKNVFKYDNNDKPIKYKPYSNDYPISNLMEKTFNKKCTKSSINNFFYPNKATDFFKKNSDFSNIYPACCNIHYYNTCYNEQHYKKNDILSYPCDDPELFFKNNQLQSKFHNYAQTEPLRINHKFISSYDRNINKITNNKLSCRNSFNDTSML